MTEGQVLQFMGLRPYAMNVTSNSHGYDGMRLWNMKLIPILHDLERWGVHFFNRRGKDFKVKVVTTDVKFNP